MSDSVPDERLYADVILPLATPAMTFSVPEHLAGELAEGSCVIVQLGARKYYTGVVRRIHGDRPVAAKVKPVERTVGDRPAATSVQLRLWDWLASYYMCPLGLVMRAAVPAALKSGGLSVQEAVDGSYSPPQETFVALHPSVRNEADLHAALDSLSRARGQYRAMTEYLERTGPPDFDDPKFVPRRLLTASPAVLRALTDKCLLRSVRREAVGKEGDAVRFRLPELTPAQQRCFERIGELVAGTDVVLLHGVTGSSKTEIYIRLIAEELRAGRNVLYMLPEIALTAQLIGRMRDHFGDAVIVYHSRLTDNRRADVYRRLIGGSGGRLVVGVRSSVLLPLPLLSLVIVDEEHENSFKQADSAPRYHGRDTAVMLAALCGAKTLLGSATPSVESYFNAATGKYGLVTLAERYGGAVLPRVIVSDTLRAAKRGEKRSHFNKVLLDRIGEALQAGSQAILFQNRRGFSPYVECGHCGWTANCPDCNVSLTYHKSDGSLRCHYCGYRIPVPAVCPSCGTGSLLPRGFGTEKIEQELAAIFPEAAIDRLDADTSQSAGGYRRIVEAFEQGRTDILIGTQIVTKGFDFGGVSLVGILNADNLLNYPDFRAGERAFQLMTQVGGRAGRRSEPGTVVIQTAQPQHPVIEQVLRGDYRAMVRSQLAERRAFFYPPYCRLIAVVMRHRDKELLWRAAGAFAGSAREVFGRRLLGPEAPPVDRIRGRFLVRFLLKIERRSPSAEAKRLLQELFGRLHARAEFRSVEVAADVDPM